MANDDLDLLAETKVREAECIARSAGYANYGVHFDERFLKGLGITPDHRPQSSTSPASGQNIAIWSIAAIAAGSMISVLIMATS